MQDVLEPSSGMAARWSECKGTGTLGYWRHVVRIMEGQADRVLEGHVSVLWGHAGWNLEKTVKMPGG